MSFEKRYSKETLERCETHVREVLAYLDRQNRDYSVGKIRLDIYRTAEKFIRDSTENLTLDRAVEEVASTMKMYFQEFFSSRKTHTPLPLPRPSLRVQIWPILTTPIQSVSRQDLNFPNGLDDEDGEELWR